MNEAAAVALVSLLSSVVTASALLYQNAVNNKRDENRRAGDAAERQNERDAARDAIRVARKQALQDHWRDKRAEAHARLLSAFQTTSEELRQGEPSPLVPSSDQLTSFGTTQVSLEEEIRLLLSELGLFCSLVSATKGTQVFTGLLALRLMKLEARARSRSLTVGDWRQAQGRHFEAFHEYQFSARNDLIIPDFEFADAPDR